MNDTAFRFALLGIPLLLLGAPSSAQESSDAPIAPPLVVDAWTNVPETGPPNLLALRGQPVLVEFWATSQKQCGKTIPHAQALHDRYGELGLMVIAVAYEPPKIVRQLVKKRGYTIPIASDTGMVNYQSYRISEVPLACLIGADGTIKYLGPPEAVDLAIETALGIEASVDSLLAAYLAAPSAGEEEAARRSLLDRLILKAPRAFDLASWSADSAGEVPSDAELAEGVENGASALRAYAQASWAGESDRCNSILFAMATASMPRSFDLKAWSRAELGRRYPLEAQELDQLLASGRNELVFDALLYREPTAELRKKAVSNAKFSEYCGHVVLESRSLARKGMLAQYWVFPGVEPKSRQRLWSDLGIGGMTKIVGVAPTFSIGTERVNSESIGPFVDELLLRYLAARSFASKRAPAADGLVKKVEKEREKMLESLVARHGELESGNR